MQYENNKFYYDSEKDICVLIHYHHNANLYYATYRTPSSIVNMSSLLDLTEAQNMVEITAEEYYVERMTDGDIYKELAELHGEISEITARIRNLQNMCKHKNKTTTPSHDSGESAECICPDCDKRWREYGKINYGTE